MAAEVDLELRIGTQVQPRAIAELAGRQHGVVSRRQLLELGMGRRAIGTQLERGRLHSLHRGVYAVGHLALTQRSRWMAAALAGGPGAVLSHRSAGALWAVTRGGGLEVTHRTKGARRPGLAFHTARLARDEVTVLDGIPVTSVPRTLLDLAAVLPADRLERALHEAEVLRLAGRLPLDTLLARHPGHRGIATLRSLLAGPVSVTRSEFEDRFLSLARSTGLPPPLTNVRIEGVEVDAVWRDARLIVELDGHAVHASRRSFEGDRAKDRALTARGWRVIRLTWRQLHEAPEAVADDLRTLLATAA